MWALVHPKVRVVLSSMGPLPSSDAFQARTSLRSPRKIFVFSIKNNIYMIKVSTKEIKKNLILEEASLPPSYCGISGIIHSKRYPYPVASVYIQTNSDFQHWFLVKHGIVFWKKWLRGECKSQVFLLQLLEEALDSDWRSYVAMKFANRVNIYRSCGTKKNRWLDN